MFGSVERKIVSWWVWIRSIRAKKVFHLGSLLIICWPLYSGYAALTPATNQDPQLVGWHHYSKQLRSDYGRFYSANNVKKLGGGLLVAGLLANTSMDEHFQHWFQVRVKTDSGDHFWNFFDRYGDKKRFLIRLAIFSGLAIFAKNTRFGKRSRRYLRHYVGALAVGVPVLLLSESVLGSGRPMDGSSSHWHSFNSNQGVSGHAFIGAVGFITAAKLTQNSTAKRILYVLSALPAIARVNNNHHYLSQAFLGWWLGYLSVNATFVAPNHQYAITPVALPQGVGVAVVFK